MPNQIKGSSVYARRSSDNQSRRSIQKQIQICRIAAEQIGSVVLQVVIERKKGTIAPLYTGGRL
jgi:hypothetical protein